MEQNSDIRVMGTGRRKSSVASVTLTPNKENETNNFIINQMSGTDYMQSNAYLIDRMQAPLTFIDFQNKVNVSVKVHGGGLVSQADAIKLGIARALCCYDLKNRSPLKLKGYLTRDARVKERKKYGLKKARKASQFSKR